MTKKTRRKMKIATNNETEITELPEVDNFALANDPPPHNPFCGEPAPECRQKVLFTGLNCLSGQQDLF